MNGWVGGLVSGWMNACGRKQVLDLELQHLVIFLKAQEMLREQAMDVEH